MSEKFRNLVRADSALEIAIDALHKSDELLKSNPVASTISTLLSDTICDIELYRDRLEYLIAEECLKMQGDTDGCTE